MWNDVRMKKYDNSLRKVWIDAVSLEQMMWKKIKGNGLASKFLVIPGHSLLPKSFLG
jgi:hypothetical protein